MKNKYPISLIFLFAFLLLDIPACLPVPAQDVPTIEATNTATQTNTPAPTGTLTPVPSPTDTPLPTVTPTLEPRLPSGEPPAVSPGAVISPENAGRVVELAGWGQGYDFQFFLSQMFGGGRIVVQRELPDPSGLLVRTRFWEAPAGRLGLELILPEDYAALYGSPDGTRFAIYQNYCQRENPQPCVMEVRSYPENELLASFDPGLTFNAAFSPDNQVMAVSNKDGIALWDLNTGKLARRLSPPAASDIYDIIKFSHDGKMLAGTQNIGTGTVGVWQVEDGQLLATLVSQADNQIAPGYSPSEMEFSPDGKSLLLVYGGSVVVWNVSDWSQGPVWTWDGANGITRLAFSPDGRLIAAGGGRGGITLADAATGKVLASWDLHEDDTYDFISDLVFSPDGRLLISLSMDQTLRFWGVPGKNK